MNRSEPKREVNDLSLLSLLAAHELEQLQRDEHSEGRYLSALRDQLADQVLGPGRTDVRNIAPSTVQLYRRAVREATNNDPADFPALKQELNKLLEQLRLVSETKRRSSRTIEANLKPLLAFLLSIHGQLLAQKQRLSASRGANRFRV
jgi:hypothetical protein